MKLSIITCTYNSEKFLQETINSVIKQNLNNKIFEHIFIDGNSSDNTIKIIKNYKKKYPDNIIKLINRKPNGIYNAMNNGIKEAKGDYLLFLHSDDYLETNILNDYLIYITDTGNLDLYYARFNAVNEKGNFIYNAPLRKIYQKGLKKWLFGLLCYINQPTVLHKRKLHNKIGAFNENLKIGSDTEFYIKLAKINATSLFYNKTVNNFRVHENSLSSSKISDTIAPVERRILLDTYYGNEKYIYIFIMNIFKYLVKKQKKTMI